MAPDGNRIQQILKLAYLVFVGIFSLNHSHQLKFV